MSIASLGSKAPRARALLALLLVIAVGVLAAGCGGDVNSKKAQNEIKKGLAAQTKGDVKFVKCPEGVKAQKGGTFQCEALIPVTVTQIDANGSLRWQITSFVGPPAGATGTTGPKPPVGATAPAAPPAGATAPGGLPAGGKTSPQPPGAAPVKDDARMVTFRNRAEGYSIDHPRLWKKSGSGTDVIFPFAGGAKFVTRFVHVIVFPGTGVPTVVQARKDLNKQKGVQAIEQVKRTTLNGDPALTATFKYKTASQPVQVIDRYIVSRGGKRVVIELGATETLRNKPPLKKKFARVLKSFRWLT
jgi:uncharacterized protein DUF4333